MIIWVNGYDVVRYMKEVNKQKPDTDTVDWEKEFGPSFFKYVVGSEPDDREGDGRTLVIVPLVIGAILGIFWYIVISWLVKLLARAIW